MSRRVCRPRDDSWHDGGVGHAQALNTAYAELRVDDGKLVHAHFACTDRMSKACRSGSSKISNIFCGRLWAGNHFDLADIIKGALVSKFASDFYGANNGS